MAKTVKVVVRIDPELEEKAEVLYSNLGMTLGEAITVFLHRSVEEGGIPFDMHEQVQRNNFQAEAAVVESVESEPAEPAAEPAAAQPEAGSAATQPESGANNTQPPANPE